MNLAIIQRWDKRIHGGYLDTSPDGHYLELLSIDSGEFFEKDFGVYKNDISDGNISIEIVNRYEKGEYDLALLKTFYLKILQRKWKTKHSYISRVRNKRMECLSQLKSFQDPDDLLDYQLVLCRIDGMPEIESDTCVEYEEDSDDYNIQHNNCFLYNL